MDGRHGYGTTQTKEDNLILSLCHWSKGLVKFQPCSDATFAPIIVFVQPQPSVGPICDPSHDLYQVCGRVYPPVGSGGDYP